MSLTLRAELVKILPEITGESARGPWRRCNFIVRTQEQYPKEVCISAWSEKIDEVKTYQPGAILDIYVNLESREYNERWYTDVRVWRLEAAGAAPAPGAAPGAVPPQATQQQYQQQPTSAPVQQTPDQPAAPQPTSEPVAQSSAPVEQAPPAPADDLPF